MTLKPWPEDAIALVSLRIHDLYCNPWDGIKICHCWNCEHAIGVGPRNYRFHTLNPDITFLLCGECYRIYLRRQRVRVLTLAPFERTKPRPLVSVN